MTNIELDRGALSGRAFLLGSGSGFVLHLPAEEGVRDRTLHPSKWYGAAGFGRHYLSALRLWLVDSGELIALNRSNQVGLAQDLVAVMRRYEVNGLVMRQTVFLPGGCEAVLLRIEADGEAEIVAEPQFDLRYYQAFNSDFGGYRAGVDLAGRRLWVTNSIPPPAPELTRLDFAVVAAALEGDAEISLLPPTERLRHKTYLVDEHRQKVVHGAALETHVEAPDEAPIWDQYETTVFAPARLRGRLPLTLGFGFGAAIEEAEEALQSVRAGGTGLRTARTNLAEERLRRAQVSTGDSGIDTAHAQVFCRFDQCLVARNAPVRAGQGQPDSRVSAIFAGDKYFLDPWKRDENISLGALLATGDYETARTILDDTWQHQDQRTGRLPQIMRLGEKLVYFSSDGTLWALRRLHEYTRASGDSSLLAAKYPLVEHFFAASLPFVRRGLLPSGGVVDPAYLWETWMDTPYTPRDGYPVEIELLWLTNLAIYGPVIEAHNPTLARQLAETLAEGRETFTSFYLDGYLADSLGYEWNPRTVLTPNGYIAFALDYPLPADLASEMVALGRRQLAGRVGIRSLAPRDWARVLSPEFMADPRNFDGPNMASVGIYNYHRGVEWLWLNQFFVRGELRYGDADHAYTTYLAPQVHAALHEGGIGGLSELHDIHGPLGADFQAWSMAGFVEELRAFAGVSVDAQARTVAVCPSLPRRWDRLSWSSRVGDWWLAFRCARTPDGLALDVEPVDGRMEGCTVRVGLPVEKGGGTGRVIVDGRQATTADCRIADGRAWIEVRP